jgi:hypothetical protein
MHGRELLRLFAAAAGALPFVPESADAAIEIGRRLHLPDRFAPRGMLDLSQARFVGELAGSVLAETGEPAARDVDLAGFIARLLTEWYDYEDAERFLADLATLDHQARERYGIPLLELDGDRRSALLEAREARDGTAGSPEASWARLKAMAWYGVLSWAVTREVEPLAVSREPRAASW